jgi:hypothetical protein
MLINLIVGFVTLGVIGAIVFWLCFPGVRSSIEAPKHQVARWDREST